MNLGNINLNVLKVLDVLLAEGSETRGQAAGPVQQLQHLLADELLVPSPEASC